MRLQVVLRMSAYQITKRDKFFCTDLKAPSVEPSSSTPNAAVTLAPSAVPF